MAAEGLCINEQIPNKYRRKEQPHPKQISLFLHSQMTGAENPPPSNFRRLVLGCIEAKFCK